MKTMLLNGLGFLFLLFGAVGLLLPVWPTTPFVLLSFACFSSSPRIRARILKISFFREHIENYERRRGLSRKTVALSLAWLWGMLLISVALSKTAWISFLLFAVGVAVTVHIACMARAKDIKKKEKE